MMHWRRGKKRGVERTARHKAKIEVKDGAERRKEWALTLEDYFASGASVCPYAKRAQIEFIHYGEIEQQLRRWTGAIAARGVSVIVAADLARDRTEAKWWVIKTLMRLRRLLGDKSSLWLEDRISPFITAGLEKVYAIGMGPQYPIEHPRYAPQLCLVAVNELEIRAVPQEDRRPIWRAMHERAGGVYNPDNAWLEILPVGN